MLCRSHRCSEGYSVVPTPGDPISDWPLGTVYISLHTSHHPLTQQHGILASGGGTADRTIRFWNTSTNQPLQSMDTGSQVCNLAWSKSTNELVSTHGYSQNQIVIWRYPSLTQVAKLTGHTTRVLYLVSLRGVV